MEQTDKKAPRIKLKMIRIVKAAILLFLLVVVSFMTWNFLSRSTKRPKSPLLSDITDQYKIEKKVRIKHFEDERGKLIFSASAERQFVGQDELFHWEGAVEVVFLKKVDGQDIRFYGNEVIHDREGKHFLLKGKARVEFQDLSIQSSALEYLAKEGVVRTKKGVRFSSGRIKGSAQGIECRVRRQSFNMRKNVRLQLFSRVESLSPVIIHGEELDYSHKGGKGIIKKKVRLFQGQSQGIADEVKFLLLKGKQNIKYLSLKGNVQVSGVTEEKGMASLEAASSPIPKEKWKIKADELFLKSFEEILHVKRVRAKGNCLFQTSALSGGFIRIHAERLDCSFSSDGYLKIFKAAKNVEMIQRQARDGEERYIHGDFLYVRERNALKIKGKEETKAKIFSHAYEISSPEISSFFYSNTLQTKKGVSVVLHPLKERQGTIGFFSKEQPIFVSAGRMEYSDKKERYLFKENVRVWQDKDVLLSEKMTLLRSSGEMQCRDNVRLLFSYFTKKDKTEKKIEMTAKTMRFNPEEFFISFKEDSFLKVDHINLASNSLVVYLSKETREMIDIISRGDVNIEMDSFKGQGEEANCELSKETVTLVGNPVLMDKTRGRTTGDKLTFHISDGKITVENTDRGRSLTVIEK